MFQRRAGSAPPPTTGGTIGGLEKTTVYLPGDLKAAVRRAAAQRGVSEAEVVRQSIREAVGDDRPLPRSGIFSSGRPVARHAEELLSGFGER